MNQEMKMAAPRQRRVVFYGRVSTALEAQISALENQMKWYQDLANHHPEWIVVKQYKDEGISGTRIKNRPGFMKMIGDAKKKKFDLIVTREVSRFARNTVDALVVTRELKQYGVEVYFVNDGIWTMDGDGELRLTIMASLAQDESRKFSERVKAGIKVAQSKGTYLTGVCPYGYRRDKKNKTFIIREDQAEIVRRIYAMYRMGMGYKAIANKLTEEGILNASGNLQWSIAQVYNIIKNPVYIGYKTYNRTHVTDYLTHAAVKNDKSEYTYVKCNFEPIIAEEEWEACQKLLGRRKAYLDGNVSDAYKYGKSNHPDKWACRMFCTCGSRLMVTVRGATQNNMYRCYRKIKNMEVKGNERVPEWQKFDCGAPSVSEWKLELMAREIFQQVWEKQKDAILDYYAAENKKREAEPDNTEAIANKKRVIAQAQEALREAEDMLRKKIILKQTYDKTCRDYEVRIQHAQEELATLESKPQLYDLNKIAESLDWKETFPDGKVSREFLDYFVPRIFVVDAQRYVWELNLSQKTYSMECNVRGTFRFPSVTTQQLEEGPAVDKKRVNQQKGGDAETADTLDLNVIRGDTQINIWARGSGAKFRRRLQSRIRAGIGSLWPVALETTAQFAPYGLSTATATVKHNLRCKNAR